MGSIRQHTAGRVTDFTSSICAIDDRMQFNGGGHPRAYVPTAHKASAILRGLRLISLPPKSIAAQGIPKCSELI
jgi:hypothetical protein